jgi:AAA15 family ATPase/GTPase
MVLRELRTDALEGLATYEQLELLNSIDSLRSQGISHYVSLPQIIVCGDQSSGKSSVLEAISGVSFLFGAVCVRDFLQSLSSASTPRVASESPLLPINRGVRWTKSD